MEALPETSLYASSLPEYIAKLTKLREQLSQSNVPTAGLGEQKAEIQIRKLAEAIPRATAPNYFGFVTGGVLPIAARADHLVTEADANVGAHLPDVSIASNVEDTTIRWLLEMFNLDPTVWRHRILTTGATASNIIGLALGRDYVIQKAAERQILGDVSVAKLGLAGALNAVGSKGIRVLSSMPHSSSTKAASIVGLGRDSFVDVSAPGEPTSVDITRLEEELSQSEYLSIVSISCGEVNTGLFATTGQSMERIRSLCTQYSAWLHVDGAFGLMARILDPKTYPAIYSGVEGIELADSITGDAHKLFNVPYDCGFFVSKHLDLATSVFQNAGAAYLATAPQAIPSAMNIGIENSRRFRALPLYASLLAYGVDGYRDMLQRQIATARLIAKWIARHPAYELLPIKHQQAVDLDADADLDSIYMIVLFRAKDESLNLKLGGLINATGEIYVTGTKWDGRPGVRISVANWQVDAQKQASTVQKVLEQVLV